MRIASKRLAIPICLFWLACKKEPAPTASTVCFEQTVAPVIQGSCALSGCHDSTRSGGYDFSTYPGILAATVAGDSAASPLYRAIQRNNSPMPPVPFNRLSDSNISMLGTYIQERARTDLHCGDACDTTMVGYQQTIAPIVEAYCGICHGQPYAAGTINLMDYQHLEPFLQEGSFYSSIVHDGEYSPMPKGNLQLPECKLELIKKWKNQGYPNN
ncbi:MAG: hypothetical protein IPL65_20035 [Lewinellaceae bacterium]|nr:hypothetical protein [Lewinellaceae bacterium]